MPVRPLPELPMATPHSLTIDQMNYFLDLYDPVFNCTLSRKRKPYSMKSPGELDKFRYEEFPALLKKRGGHGKPHGQNAWVEKDELIFLMGWKLTRGIFRPALQAMIANNSPENIRRVTQDAFSLLPDCIPKFPENEQQAYNNNGSGPDPVFLPALLHLTSLNGVGPATASLLLASVNPDVCPFFADELHSWLVDSHDEVALKSGARSRTLPKPKLKYSQQEYQEVWYGTQNLRYKLQTAPGQPVSAAKLERAAYVISKLESGEIWSNVFGVAPPTNVHSRIPPPHLPHMIAGPPLPPAMMQSARPEHATGYPPTDPMSPPRNASQSGPAPGYAPPPPIFDAATRQYIYPVPVQYGYPPPNPQMQYPYPHPPPPNTVGPSNVPGMQQPSQYPASEAVLGPPHAHLPPPQGSPPTAQHIPQNQVAQEQRQDFRPQIISLPPIQNGPLPPAHSTQLPPFSVPHISENGTISPPKISQSVPPAADSQAAYHPLRPQGPARGLSYERAVSPRTQAPPTPTRAGSGSVVSTQYMPSQPVSQTQYAATSPTEVSPTTPIPPSHLQQQHHAQQEYRPGPYSTLPPPSQQGYYPPNSASPLGYLTQPPQGQNPHPQDPSTYSQHPNQGPPQQPGQQYAYRPAMAPPPPPNYVPAPQQQYTQNYPQQQYAPSQGQPQPGPGYPPQMTYFQGTPESSNTTPTQAYAPHPQSSRKVSNSDPNGLSPRTNSHSQSSGRTVSPNSCNAMNTQVLTPMTNTPRTSTSTLSTSSKRKNTLDDEDVETESFRREREKYERAQGYVTREDSVKRQRQPVSKRS